MLLEDGIPERYTSRVDGASSRAYRSSVKPPGSGRILAARIIAVAADAIQLGLMPLFAGGAPTLLDAALDVVVAGLMVALVGWRWYFLPSFLAELVPFADLAPTWTLAVMLATRKGSEPVPSVVVDPASRPPVPPRLPPTGVP